MSAIIEVINENHVCEITINRPEALNALNDQVFDELALEIEKVNQDDNIRVCIITGAGEKAFVAGADISLFNTFTPEQLQAYITKGQAVMRSIESSRVPVIAAVNGFALGGGLELALACDIIVASKKAKLGTPEVKLGVIPGFGGTQRLIHRCGIGHARWLVYSAEMIGAQMAHTWGLVDEVVEPQEVKSRAHALAQTIASRGPLAVQASKELIRESQDEQLVSGLMMEVETFCEVFDSQDRQEGVSAFFEKREAQWKNK